MRSAIPIVGGVAAAVVVLMAGGCAHVKVDPIQVQTIHIVHDVNISVDKTLEDFFAFQESQATTRAAATTQATQPTTQTAAAATATDAAGEMK
jgi:hypothetical protein